MITGELKIKIDKIWDTIWTAGISSPITVLEQITYLMFMKLLDDNEIKKEGNASALGIADLSKCGMYIDDTAEKISQVAVEKSNIKLIPKNTVIMSFKLSIGKVAITNSNMYSNEAIMAFHNKGIIKIDPEYLYFLLLAKDWDVGTNKAVMGKTLNKARRPA